MAAPVPPVPCRRRPSRWWPLVVCAAAMAGCGAASSEVRDATLVVGVAQGPSATDANLGRVAALLGRASLLRLDRDCRVLPGLALEVTPDSDATAWTLRLRDGLRFHDGTRLDATAVADLLPPYPGVNPATLPPGLRDVSRVTRSDARTLRIEVREPSALLPEALASIDVTGGTDASSGAGPFIADRVTPDEISLRPFQGFHLGRPTIDRVVLRSYPTTRAAWAALMRREIDSLYELAPEAAPFVESTPGVQVHSFLRPFVHVLGFNLRHPALADAGVRRRLAGAVDREGLVRSVLGGRGQPAYDPVWPLHWARHEVVAPDTESETGEGPGRRSGVTPTGRLRLGCLLPAGVPAFERLGLAVQHAMYGAGVDLRLEPVPLDALGRRLATGAFDTYLLELNAFGLGWTYRLWHSEASRALVDSGYRGADGALDAMRRARDEAELRAAVGEVQRRLRADPPAVFLYWTRTSRAVTTRFALPESVDRDIIASVARWHLAPLAR